MLLSSVAAIQRVHVAGQADTLTESSSTVVVGCVAVCNGMCKLQSAIHMVRYNKSIEVEAYQTAPLRFS